MNVSRPPPSLPQLDIFEVFMLDSDFKVERPKRIYRQGLNILHHNDHGGDDQHQPAQFPRQDGAELNPSAADRDGSEKSGKLRSLRSGFARVFHHSVKSAHSLPPPPEKQHDVQTSTTFSPSSYVSTSFVGSEDGGENAEGASLSPVVDPSTNMDPLRAETWTDEEMSPRLCKEGESHETARKKKRRVKDVSRHTFFIENSQMRLRLLAKNGVGLPFLFSMHRNVC